MNGKLNQFVVTLVVYSFGVWTAQAASPVVLWTLKSAGGGNSESNLNEFPPQQFADLVAWKSEQGNIPIIAFGLNSLSLEDLTPEGRPNSAEPFRKLRKITDASAETLLFPSVLSASESLRILQKKGFKVLEVNAGESLPKLEASNTILVISEKPSVNMDDEILRVFSKYTVDFPNIMGMLWGKRSTWIEEPDEEVNDILSRKKRQAVPVKEPTYTFNDHRGLLLALRSVNVTIIAKDARTTVKFTTPTIPQPTTTDNETTFTMNFNPPTASIITKFALTIKVEKNRMGYWRMATASAAIEGKDKDGEFQFPNSPLSSTQDMTVPLEWSYHCSRFGNLYQKNKDEQPNHTYLVNILGLQLEAFAPDTATKFNEAYECVGFFTAGIWSGIFVTILLIAILTWGLKMLMDVKTMDRFDDPKGKPISFGGSE